jgi:Putative lumazine-binding
MKIRTIFTTFTTITLLTFAITLRAQDETKNVMTVLEQFFTAINTNDSASFKKIFLPAAHLFLSRPGNDTLVYASRPVAEITTSLFKAGQELRETMRNTGVKVEVHQNIAMAWVPYNFHRNKAFTHCGIDVFTLMKTTKGWKIALIAYSVEKTGCDEW